MPHGIDEDRYEVMCQVGQAICLPSSKPYEILLQIGNWSYKFKPAD